MSTNFNLEILIKLFLISFASSLSVAYIFYPGFMTYDSIHALQGARDGIMDSMWPPMVSYIWRVLDHIVPYPTAMHFFQVFFVYINISFIIYFYTKKTLNVFLVLTLITIIPSLLGSLAAIWKDVLMAGLLMTSFSLLLLLKSANNSRTIFWLSFFFILFTFLSICTRHNAVVATVPTVILYAYYIFDAKGYIGIKKIFLSIMVGLLLIISLYELKTQLIDKYSLPSMQKLDSNTNTFLRTVRILDITGASICAGENYFGTMGPYYTLEDLIGRYHPQHINLSADLINNIPQDQRIDDIWYSLPSKNFLCAFAHKTNLTSYLFGLNKGEIFLVTEPVVVSNPYGYILATSHLREIMVKYIFNSSKFFIFRPWFLQIISFICIIYLLYTRKGDYILFGMYTSALFYSLSLIVFGNAADARLMFFTNLVNALIILLTINFIINYYTMRQKNANF